MGENAAAAHRPLLATLLRVAVVVAFGVLVVLAFDRSEAWRAFVVGHSHPVHVIDPLGEYRFALGWAAVLGIVLACLPLRERDALLFAWVVKVGVVLGFMLLYEAHYLALDAYGYYLKGASEAFPPGRLLSGTENVARLAWAQQHALPVSYSALKVTWAFLGLGACWIFWRALVDLGWPRRAMLLLGLALFPSILFWSSILGKDPLVLLGLAALAWAAVAFHVGRLRAGAWTAVGGFALLVLVRPWLASMAAFPVALPLIVRVWGRYPRARGLAVVIGGVAAVFAIFFFAYLFQVTSIGSVVGYIDSLSRAWAIGGSGEEPPRFEDIWDLLLYVPIGGFTAHFRPLLFEVGTSPYGILAGLENTLYLVIVLVALARGRWKDAKHPLVVATVIYLFTWTALYAFVSPQNLGSAFRFRVQALPFVLALAAWFARPGRARGEQLLVGATRAAARAIHRNADRLGAALVHVAAAVLLAPSAIWSGPADPARRLVLTRRDPAYFRDGAGATWIAQVPDLEDGPRQGGVREEPRSAKVTEVLARRTRDPRLRKWPRTDAALARASFVLYLARLVSFMGVAQVLADDGPNELRVGRILARLRRVPLGRAGGPADGGPLRVSVVTPRYDVSGVPLAQIRLAKALARRGHDVTLVVGCVNKGYVLPPVPGVTVEVLGAERVLSMFPALVEHFRACRPEVVFSAEDHLNAITLAAAVVARSKARISASSRVTPFDTYSRVPFTKRWFLRWIVGALMPRADALTCVSQDMVAQYRQVFPRGEHICVYNIVLDEDAEARMGEVVDEPWFDEDPPVVVAAGSLQPWKGFTVLLRAVAEARRSRDLRLVLLGEGPQRPELEALARDLGIEAHVRLLGRVENPLKYFARADAFVLSSSVEGLPNVLVEAMMCGCTPVATDCPTGPREVLQDGRFGRLVPVGDVSALAVAILAALDDPIDPKVLREAVRPFSEDLVLRRHAQLLGLPALAGRVGSEESSS